MESFCTKSRFQDYSVAVDRPPYSKAHPVTANMFYDEFVNHLENVVMCPEILIISGDFNFHQNYSTNSDANTFTELLETFSLLQYGLLLCVQFVFTTLNNSLLFLLPLRE